MTLTTFIFHSFFILLWHVLLTVAGAALTVVIFL